MRASGATQSGYWKSTWKDKAVYSSAGSHLIGAKKMPVFYGGRAPRRKKTGWVMQEYALKERVLLRGAHTTRKLIFVVYLKLCRVFCFGHTGKVGIYYVLN
ncbi:hypothetical protein PR202_ga21056 [Eleusine coracana subsp. coracana]|uniref:NAC domain-containing protein n=1 Tax=Eleusine coracana subsp. coracana TaxID=191504 RepID=A0AAV5D0E1_ELECO|nr:hypothetical protein PR202_ga21056 [Eleusine coracana subsp. coracana]